MEEDYARAVGASLRRIRLRRGLSLQDVQAASGGRWKAAIVGAYERGDRNVTVARLSELAEFYGVSVEETLPQEDVVAPRSGDRQRIVLRIDHLDRLPEPERGALERFVVAINSERGAAAESTLEVRDGDLLALALLFGSTDRAELTGRLESWGVL